MAAWVSLARFVRIVGIRSRVHAHGLGRVPVGGVECQPYRACLDAPAPTYPDRNRHGLNRLSRQHQCVAGRRPFVERQLGRFRVHPRWNVGRVANDGNAVYLLAAVSCRDRQFDDVKARFEGNLDAVLAVVVVFGVRVHGGVDMGRGRDNGNGFHVADHRGVAVSAGDEIRAQDQVVRSVAERQVD